MKKGEGGKGLGCAQFKWPSGLILAEATSAQSRSPSAAASEHKLKIDQLSIAQLIVPLADTVFWNSSSALGKTSENCLLPFTLMASCQEGTPQRKTCLFFFFFFQNKQAGEVVWDQRRPSGSATSYLPVADLGYTLTLYSPACGMQF